MDGDFNVLAAVVEYAADCTTLIESELLENAGVVQIPILCGVAGAVHGATEFPAHDLGGVLGRKLDEH